MPAFVTGATGLLGSNIVNALGRIAAFSGQLACCDLLVRAAAYFREYYGPGDHWDLRHGYDVIKAPISLIARRWGTPPDPVPSGP
jgi:hypothetical protein